MGAFNMGRGPVDSSPTTTRETALSSPRDSASLPLDKTHAAPASPPPLAAELGFTRVRPPIDWPKSDKSDFGWRDREGGCDQSPTTRRTERVHPLPNPPPQAGEGAHRAHLFDSEGGDSPTQHYGRNSARM